MDEGCKTSETLFHLMTDLGMSDIAQPIPMFNILNDPSWQLDAITQATLVNWLTGILHASHHWGHGKLQPGPYSKDAKENPSARSTQTDKAANDDARYDWKGQAELNWSQAFSILWTYKCPVCRSAKHSLAGCTVALKRGFKVTYCADNHTGTDYQPPCQGAGGAPRRSDTAYRSRAEAASNPAPAPSPTTTPAPAQAEGLPPASHDKVVGFKAGTPSISCSKAFDSASASDDDQFLDWGGTNKDVIHALERTQSQKTKATKAHRFLANFPVSLGFGPRVSHSRPLPQQVLQKTLRHGCRHCHRFGCLDSCQTKFGS
jgi:hypothetical protein